MQSPEMCASRSLRLKNLALIHCRFSRRRWDFHPVPNRKVFSTSVSSEDAATSSWTVFASTPLDGASAFPSDSDSASTPAPTNSDSPPPRISSPRGGFEVKTVYDPITGRTVTKKERSGGNDAELPSPGAEVGTRVYEEVNLGSSTSAASTFSKKGKSKSVYVCQNCGNSKGQWWGYCMDCGETGTLKLFSAGSVEKNVSGKNVIRSWFPNEISDNKPVRIRDVCNRMDALNWRIHLPGPFGDEVQRVLGGGLVPGSLVLVGGEPGVGKSTLLLQVAALLSEEVSTGDPAKVLYVSGEESIEQIANRADRLQIVTEELFLYSSTDIEEILQQAQALSPKAIIVDSIQTVYLKGVSGVVGSTTQVKECAAALLRFAKKSCIPVFLVGHVTKSGDIAGPQVLEHIVDVVLYMEGEKSSSHRLLRAMKNRYGSTDELGVFEMLQSGLQGVSNPSEMFLSEHHSTESHYLAGRAVAVVMDGSRAFLIEIQALCIVGTSGGRHVNGVPSSRADMIISVIMKQAGLKLQENRIFINVVSGFSLSETGGDLAVAAAICSSFLEFPIPKGVAFIAEIGLGGELRAVPQLERRVNTLSKLGYKKCIIPKSAAAKLQHQPQEQGMEILGCKDLKEMIATIFK